MIEALAVLGGYVLGSMPFGYWVPLLVRHEDIRTTLNTYGSLFPAAQEAMPASLDAAYKAAAKPALNVRRLRGGTAAGQDVDVVGCHEGP